MNGNTKVIGLLENADEIFLPAIALGELYFGAENSKQRDDNLERIEELAKEVVILMCDAETAKWYGLIQKQLRDKGRPIPQNDIWIAAVTLQHDLTLLTNDKHFEEVDKLKRANW